jgi:hypothetical protein
MNEDDNKMLNAIIEATEEESYLVADGFNGAIIGLDEASGRLIYSETKCLEILMRDENMTMESAIEHFEFNVKGSWVGELTPIWCSDGFL